MHKSLTPVNAGIADTRSKLLRDGRKLAKNPQCINDQYHHTAYGTPMEQHVESDARHQPFDDPKRRFFLVNRRSLSHIHPPRMAKSRAKQDGNQAKITKPDDYEKRRNSRHPVLFDLIHDYSLFSLLL
jgi:hypothetical protein